MVSCPYFLELIRQVENQHSDVAGGTGRLLLDYAQKSMLTCLPHFAGHDCRACYNANKLGLHPNSVCPGHAKPRPAAPVSDHHLYVPLHSSTSPTAICTRRCIVSLPICSLAACWPCPCVMDPNQSRLMEIDAVEVDCEIDAEAIRPADGALIRRWFRCRYDVEHRLQHTEDRYEIIRDDRVRSNQSSPRRF